MCINEMTLYYIITQTESQSIHQAILLNHAQDRYGDKKKNVGDGG